ncbi:cell cycle checkpoint control protein RAD9A [Quillaja saponaria]|uniref:Cell cycle checkpoint control protein RAD9A n=1 Tax=Quillaja saponaria TaxID=32244 RepID=A0AAD7Q1W0_QUISA|nr:cell cycle checkpoint control protein RAD9A [Quillaja saponaria]KAJ7973339.1 cell cycle checkpoint control protein RAD9A [Quillaja saponaria]
MEFSLSGNALKTFARCVTCLARIGNELAIQASSSQLVFHTLNSSRSAYQSITFKPGFFDVYTVSGNQVQCSVLLKAVCSVLRTPIANIDHLTVSLPDSDAPKVKWILECYSGMKKSYWITCNVEPDIQHLSLDRRNFPSSFIVRPRDLNRLLANFQSSLQEITLIATEPTSLPSDAASEIGGKAVELRSYIDPTKDNDSTLHTQLWIDPTEEFVQYMHTGDPVDVTFAMKELKAFLSFCEGCEVDMHLHFEKSGEPILMAPKFGLEDGSHSNFDATLVLATMLISQLHEGTASVPPEAATTVHGQADERTEPQVHSECRTNVSEHPSDHTRIWSDLSGKNGSSAEERQVRGEKSLNASEHREIQRISRVQISKAALGGDNNPAHSDFCQPMEKQHAQEPRDKSEIDGQLFSQHHPSNWVDAEEGDEDDADEDELCVQSTPTYYEEQ